MICADVFDKDHTYMYIYIYIRHRAVGTACVFRGTCKAFSLKLLAHQGLRFLVSSVSWFFKAKALGTPTPDSSRGVGIRGVAPPPLELPDSLPSLQDRASSLQFRALKFN